MTPTHPPLWFPFRDSQIGSFHFSFPNRTGRKFGSPCKLPGSFDRRPDPAPPLLPGAAPGVGWVRSVEASKPPLAMGFLRVVDMEVLQESSRPKPSGQLS